MILFIFYFISANASITYDQGYYNGFSLPISSTFICKDNFQQTATVTFNQPFNNIPQVFLGLEFLDFDKGIEYKLSITTITTTHFEVLIECITSIQVFSVEFSWYAIDDKRIQVINNFNMVPPGVNVFNHINPNINFGIVSITSLGIDGDIDFQLAVSSVNQSTVSVSITQVAGNINNLKQIGYQVILGIPEAFLGSKNNPLTTAFNSGTLTQQSNRWLFLSFTGFKMSSALKQKVTRNPSPLSYFVTSIDVGFVSCNHQISWLAYQFTTFYKPFECQSVRLSQSNDDQASTKPSIQIYISELNLTLDQPQNKLIFPQITQLNLQVYVKCQVQKKILSQFLRCYECNTNKQHKLWNYCNQQIDVVTYFLKYQTTQQVFKELSINITSDSITIIQVLYNQAEIQQVILEILIQDM
ncbi:unnamed protein product (macronuclear) [Paramecium tetraurelia]|uniref:H-type lectin domain-containing protein n=1 Tax=Paramecium tetraurelia TaxID=5888 RepID=A0BNU3_PARTE|nr:uncharacterized protein GSPATT00030849001 [Paramecium tetraurelia]CAK60210.1 unnamed protein product [Paramecium tetraurelia]|eukprot:XP_001427608.1 hypothetical protein (macronuclear) [Paramecium tetraurelia strain d4-2]